LLGARVRRLQHKDPLCGKISLAKNGAQNQRSKEPKINALAPGFLKAFSLFCLVCFIVVVFIGSFNLLTVNSVKGFFLALSLFQLLLFERNRSIAGEQICRALHSFDNKEYIITVYLCDCLSGKNLKPPYFSTIYQKLFILRERLFMFNRKSL